MNIVHSDLKPANILLGRPNDITSIKISDLGMSFKINLIDYNHNESIGGTLRYLSPEAILNKVYCQVNINRQWTYGPLV